ncbi:MAG: helix-hairpin-helix domain-containing protein [Deltaproteobacteria bacterium]|nr:helix-hairpin-helix domain-containing protein [Deltaproteobacteria bacterium]
MPSEYKEKDAREIVLVLLAVLLVCIYVFREWRHYPEEAVKGSSDIASPLIKSEARNDSSLNPRTHVSSNPASMSGEAKQVLALKIDINTATQLDFESLPGIGPKLAQRIIEKRKELGGFKSIDDLKKVKGIGEKKFGRIKNLIDIR